MNFINRLVAEKWLRWLVKILRLIGVVKNKKKYFFIFEVFKFSQEAKQNSEDY